MNTNMTLPEQAEDGSLSLRYAELRPSTIAEIIDCLAEHDPADGRIPALRSLYASVTGEPLT